MYLPTFQKISHQVMMKRAQRGGLLMIPVGLWMGWMLKNEFYNFIYADIYPPARGVKRREAEI